MSLSGQLKLNINSLIAHFNGVNEIDPQQLDQTILHIGELLKLVADMEKLKEIKPIVVKKDRTARMECQICGGSYASCSRASHFRSKKHLTAEAKKAGYYDYTTGKVVQTQVSIPVPQPTQEPKVSSTEGKTESDED